MKVSFQLSSKSSSTEKPKSPDNFNDQDEQQQELEEDSRTEFITEFNPETQTHQPNLIIQPLPNTWKPNPNSTSYDDKGLEEFIGVPVNGYGKAVLAGYGWYEGRGIGKNAERDVKVVQYRGVFEGKAGLGFIPRN
ncbi:hypothetical protein IFM89_021368 [Coptis chinensis]|uniref:G-patch domain-containing protein n=1 Tax=Coptis chinensis TaxID=261450 RepID=A0A835IFR9_9MAGN|nr:hypothetical protein IFM89_021368 [Coptis chinensis]